MNLIVSASVAGLVLLLSALPQAAAQDDLPAWAIGPFARPDGAEPVIKPNPETTFDDPIRGEPVNWEILHTFNPAAIVIGDQIAVLYRAEDDTGQMHIGGHTSRLGLALSDDGINFAREPEPVLYPDVDSEQEHEWPGGVEDPRIVEAPDGTYVIYYTQWNGKMTQIAAATSNDLRTWEKQGNIFTTHHGDTYRDLKFKAASVVTSLQDGRLKAAKIDGKYWMYWGEWGIRLAWSDNLLDWHVIEDEPGEPTFVLNPRDDGWDAPLVECGPPAVLTGDGIVLLYNVKVERDLPELGLQNGAYAGGQALFDPSEPTKLLDRLDKPFIQPKLEWEKTGQYAAGTTFIEGLVYFNDQWFLYYGSADSLVGVAVSSESNAGASR